MGTRRTLVAATPGAARDARRLTLPPLSPLEDDLTWRDEDGLFALDDWEDGLDDWKDGHKADDELRGDVYSTLRAPESAAKVDFTGVLPAVQLPELSAGRARANTNAPRVRQSIGVRDRVASGTRRLAEIGKMRPVVRIPGKTEAEAAGRKQGARTAKLPPVWVLANLAILLFASLAIVVPHAIQADAAAGCRWYTVRAGDTLGNIGWANHTGALTLAKANHIPNPNLIYVGQRLCIPVQQGAQAASAPAVPKTTTAPRLAAPQGVQSFVNFVLPYARSAHNQTGWPTSLILAQWGLEQGWHLPSYTGYNFGNCGPMPGEPTIGGLNVPGSPARFSYAAAPADGLRQYVKVAHLGYYTAVAPAARQSGVDAAARALGRSPWDAGHYTNTGNPGSSLLNILHSYNLYQFD